MMCEGDLDYRPSGPPCEKTCLELSTGVQECYGDSKEGCFCPEGFYRDGNKTLKSLLGVSRTCLFYVALHKTFKVSFITKARNRWHAFIW